MKSEPKWRTSLGNGLRSISSDKALLTILVVAFGLGVYGANWGRVESWHPDQMAVRQLFYEGRGFLNPTWFRKPPLYTYIHFFLSVGPTEVGKIAGFPAADMNAVRLVWSGALNALMFVGACLSFYLLVHSAFGLLAARVLTAILATSAGFVAFAHFLTPDIAVLWFMLLAFYYCYRILVTPDLKTYVLAGAFIGVATVTKYNGLGIGISLVVAHLLVWLSRQWPDWRPLILSRNLYAGLGSIPAAFVICNPYAVLDYRTFVQDFIYNYTVTPLFAGTSEGTQYLKFLALSVDLFGYPGAIFVLLGVVFSLYWLFQRDLALRQRQLLVLIFSTFIVYYIQFGRFSFLETRFVMPIYPLLLAAGGLFVQRLSPRKAYLLAAPLVVYGFLCSVYVGNRLIEDPRMHAQTWALKNLKPQATVETVPYAPDFSRLKGSTISSTRGPFVTARSKIFAPLFAGDQDMTDRMEFHEMDQNISWYSCKEFVRRYPDYVALDSLYYARFVESRPGEILPPVKEHFERLLGGGYPYRVVFDETTAAPPEWVYPKELDFLENRMLILERTDDALAPECGS